MAVNNLVKMTGAFEQPYDEEDAEMQTLKVWDYQYARFVTEAGTKDIWSAKSICFSGCSDSEY